MKLQGVKKIDIAHNIPGKKIEKKKTIINA